MGLANGFGGPVAPAESNAEADGDGGGSTTPDECGSVPFFRAVCAVVSAEALRGEVVESAAVLPESDCSSGI